MKTEVKITDFGPFPTARGNYDQLLADNLQKCNGNVRLAINRTIEVLPSFAVARFTIGMKILIAERKIVSVGKKRKRGFDARIGSTLIDTVHFKSV